MSDPWAFYDVGAPGWANDVQVLKPGRGYWVHATQESALVITPPVIPPEMEVPGCIASPGIRSRVSGQVPITLTTETQLRQVMVDYWPVNAPSAGSGQAWDGYEVLATALEAEGGSRVATLDTTVLANGSYTIRVSGVDDSGELVACGTMVTVEGEYKPGRVRFTVTDLTVPLAGLPIVVGRTYDSLERNQVGDFGHGWSLAIGNPKLEVDPDHNVTLTMPDGKRVTYYFHPETVFFLSVPRYMPEAGVYGSLKPKACGVVVASGGQWFCFPGGPYQESVSGYVYTDPYGREFEMGTDGKLRSITDLNDNVLTFTPDGITSSVGGMAVAFTRDAQDRITVVTDSLGNEYEYAYDAAGDLVEVHLPGVVTPVVYHYNPDHFFLGVDDPRGVTAATATYYPDGRLKSETDAVGNTFQYIYDVEDRATTVTNPDGGTETTAYDGWGKPLSHTDPLSRTNIYTYDSNGNRLTETNDLGHITSFMYDGNGHKTSITNPEGETMSVEYNQYGIVTSLVDGLGHVTTVALDDDFYPSHMADEVGTMATLTWDDQGNLLTRTDPHGGITTFEYDTYGNLITETNPAGDTIVFTYDSLGHQLSRTDARGNTTTYTYDALGRIVSVTDALSQTTIYKHDANGNVVALTDAMSRTTTYACDAKNQLTAIGYPDGLSETYAYNWRGNVVTETNRAGSITRYEYDLAGQLVGVVSAVGTSDQVSISYTYDGAGRRITEADPLGNVTTYAYDDFGRVISTTNSLDQITTYEYDEASNLVAITDANGRRTSYEYNARGQPTLTTYTDGSTEHRGYDERGLLVSRTDPGGKTTTYTYDKQGQMQSVVNPLSNTVSYAHDAVGNVVVITDANDHQILLEYDPLNRLTRKTWPDGSFEMFSYDAVGNLVQYYLTDEQVNTYEYDERNQLTGISYFDGRTVHITYTPTGRKRTVLDSHGFTLYEYDGLDRLCKVTNPDGETVQYSYDAAGNQLSLTTSAGTTLYAYDHEHRLVSVTNSLSETTTFGYDDVGMLTRMALPNGIVVNFGYDALNRMTSVVQKDAGGIMLASYEYVLDAVGNRLSMTEADGRTTDWSYDGDYRLISETQSEASGAVVRESTYTYDPAGNRTSMIVSGVRTDYLYNEMDQLVSADDAQYIYDGRGNLVGIGDDTGAVVYEYDAADRLVSVQLPDGTQVGYGYDWQGRRVRQETGTGVTNFIWDENSRYGDIVLETDGNGVPIASYVVAGQSVIAQTQGSVSSYYLTDGQRNTRMLVDIEGNIVHEYAYDAYGNLLGGVGEGNPYLYTGQRYDDLTGLYYLRARYYDSRTGCFLSQDKAECCSCCSVDRPIDVNRYVYAAANPVNYADPSGCTSTTLEWSFINWEMMKRSLTEIVGALAIGAAVACKYRYVLSVVYALSYNRLGLEQMELTWPGWNPCQIGILLYPAPRTPAIAAHTVYAQARGRPMLLFYNGPLNPLTLANRAIACPPGKHAPLSCEEYPYASTLFGGVGALTTGVPLAEQHIQGGLLNTFYQRDLRYEPGAAFAAVVVPYYMPGVTP